MEDLRSDVAAEEPPCGAVLGRADVKLVIVEDSTCGESRRAVGEGGPIVDKGLVGEDTVSDDDGSARPYAERDNGAVLGVEVAEDWLKLEESFAEK
ncbi:hypothetical protein F8388_019209 [Cannabis sativa]|uniref:Uncharacterized protein n=1 Tax=Cannabis sativa TaxID=3483 RepID=A0A7J6F5L9_CANSA|nr:hypothetical protein F8388_019209 [Cannabis sativa]